MLCLCLERKKLTLTGVMIHEFMVDFHVDYENYIKTIKMLSLNDKIKERNVATHF